MLAKRERQIIHSEDDAVLVDASSGAPATGSCPARAELGKVEGVAREVRDELLRREGQQALQARVRAVETCALEVVFCDFLGDLGMRQ
jgi:hypothetical protein